MGKRGDGGQKATAKTRLEQFYNTGVAFHHSSRSYKFKTLQVPSCENRPGLQPQRSRREAAASATRDPCLDLSDVPGETLAERAAGCPSNYFILMLLSLNVKTRTPTLGSQWLQSKHVCFGPGSPDRSGSQVLQGDHLELRSLHATGQPISLQSKGHVSHNSEHTTYVSQAVNDLVSQCSKYPRKILPLNGSANKTIV